MYTVCSALCLVDVISVYIFSSYLIGTHLLDVFERWWSKCLQCVVEFDIHLSSSSRLNQAGAESW